MVCPFSTGKVGPGHQTVRVGLDCKSLALLSLFFVCFLKWSLPLALGSRLDWSAWEIPACLLVFQGSDYKHRLPHLAFGCGFTGLNSGPNSCAASTLPKEPSSPHSWWLFSSNAMAVFHGVLWRTLPPPLKNKGSLVGVSAFHIMDLHITNISESVCGLFQT